MPAKKFRMIDVMLSVICVVFVAEAAAPAAAIGNQQFFWWLLLIVVFLLPYGLVVSELGTTYVAESGLYGWVKQAFGDRWASRTAFFYWINYTLWGVSLAVVGVETLEIAFGIHFPIWAAAFFELIFIWTIVGLGFTQASDSPAIMNVGAVLKVGIALLMGCLGLYHLLNHGFANDMSWETFLPSASPESLSYLSVILFNFMGFEVVATFAGSMENPQRQIPKAIVYGGIVIAAIYLFSSFGIDAAVPVREISLDSGIMDAALAILRPKSPLVGVIAVVFVLTLFGNMVSWAHGVHIVACNAAEDGNLPKVLALRGKEGLPQGASVANGLLSSAFILLLAVLRYLGFSDLFWTFFGCSIVFIMVSYLPMFPAFLKLRSLDPHARRPFTAPGGKGVVLLVAWAPVVVMVLGMVATVVPLGASPAELSKLPMLALTVAVLALGEVNCRRGDARRAARGFGKAQPPGRKGS